MGLCLPATATKEMAWMSVAARGQRAPETSCSASWVSDSWPFAVEMYLEIQSGNTVEGHPSLGEKKKKRGSSCVPHDVCWAASTETWHRAGKGFCPSALSSQGLTRSAASIPGTPNKGQKALGTPHSSLLILKGSL